MYLNSAVSDLIQRARWIKANPEQRGVLSRGQIVEVALMLNKPSWLAEAGFSLADALDRLSHVELDAVLVASRNVGDHADIGVIYP